jgi:uncharacterized iron-regulated protein
MKRSLVLPVAVLFLGLCVYFMPHCHRSIEPARILRVSDRSIVSFAEVLKELHGVPVVCFGELHDEASIHRAELELIRGLHDSGEKVAVGLEMFRADEQGQLNRWVKGEIAEEDFVPVYLQNWNFPWDLYRAIFLYCRDTAIPMIGLNIPTAVTRQVARKGFASLSENQREHLPPVTCNVDKVYQDFIRRAMGLAHDHGADFEYFCEAQLVWDTSMAWHAVKFLKEHAHYTIVILAGSGHAWKRGIAEQVRRESNLTVRVVLPETPRLNRENVTLEDADYLWLNLPLEPSK